MYCSWEQCGVFMYFRAWFSLYMWLGFEFHPGQNLYPREFVVRPHYNLAEITNGIKGFSILISLKRQIINYLLSGACVVRFLGRPVELILYG